MNLDCISAMNLGYISAHVVADLEMRIGLSKVRGALIAECREVLLQDVVGDRRMPMPGRRSLLLLRRCPVLVIRKLEAAVGAERQRDAISVRAGLLEGGDDSDAGTIETADQRAQTEQGRVDRAPQVAGEDARHVARARARASNRRAERALSGRAFGGEEQVREALALFHSRIRERRVRPPDLFADLLDLHLGRLPELLL